MIRLLLLRGLCILTVVGIFGVGLPTGLAQSEPRKAARLRFLFLDETPGAYSLKIADRFLDVSSGPYEISSPFTPLSDLKPLEIYKAQAKPDPLTGKIERIKVASFPVPMTTPSALVIITPRSPTNATTPPIYGVELIDTNPADFPAGSVRIINRGHAAVGVQLGNSSVITAPGETSVIQPARDARNRVFSKIAAQTPTGWDLLHNSITIIRPNERVIGVFGYSQSGLRHTYTDAEIAQFGAPPPTHFWLTYSDTP